MHPQFCPLQFWCHYFRSSPAKKDKSSLLLWRLPSSLLIWSILHYVFNTPWTKLQFHPKSFWNRLLDRPQISVHLPRKYFIFAILDFKSLFPARLISYKSTSKIIQKVLKLNRSVRLTVAIPFKICTWLRSFHGLASLARFFPISTMARTIGSNIDYITELKSEVQIDQMQTNNKKKKKRGRYHLIEGDQVDNKIGRLFE